MQNQPKIYNIDTFSFYRRKVKQKDLDQALIKLIEKEEQRINEEKLFLNQKMINSNSKSMKNNNYNKSSDNRVNNLERTKNLNLNLIFPKISIERINKIRDLFIEFDVDKNRTFDKDEIYLMFNTNKIPITKEEIIYLFGFNKRKKYINFNEFINLTVNEEFSNKFTKLIMEKIRYRCNESDICPNDFNDMLSHLCEFGKLSPELKEKTRNEQINNKNQNEKSDYKILDNENKNQNKSNIDEKGILDEGKEKNKFDFNNEKDINEIRENPNILKREKEYNNFMEISEKKYLRFKEFLLKANIRDKILKKQKKLSKSVKIINKINPEIAKNYISYYPTENVFKYPKTSTIISLPVSGNNQKNPNINFNKTEKIKSISLRNKKIPKNLYFHIHYKYNNNLMKLVKNKKLKNNQISLYPKNKRKFEKLKEKEYYSILADLTINNPDIQSFLQNWNNPRFNFFKNLKNKNRYTENFFKTSGFYSNLNKL